MYLLLGNSYMERSNYEDAIQSFEHARAQMRYYGDQLLLVSLVSLLMGILQDHSPTDRYPDGNLTISTS